MDRSITVTMPDLMKTIPFEIRASKNPNLNTPKFEWSNIRSLFYHLYKNLEMNYLFIFVTCETSLFQGRHVITKACVTRTRVTIHRRLIRVIFANGLPQPTLFGRADVFDRAHRRRRSQQVRCNPRRTPASAKVIRWNVIVVLNVRDVGVVWFLKPVGGKRLFSLRESKRSAGCFRWWRHFRYWAAGCHVIFIGGESGNSSAGKNSGASALRCCRAAFSTFPFVAVRFGFALVGWGDVQVGVGVGRRQLVRRTTSSTPFWATGSCITNFLSRFSLLQWYFLF